MIVAMQRLTLLCLASEREPTVEAIRELGVVHVVPVQAPEGESLEAARAALSRGERARVLLQAAAKHADAKAAAAADGARPTRSSAAPSSWTHCARADGSRRKPMSAS